MDDLSLGRIVPFVPEFAMKDLALGQNKEDDNVSTKYLKKKLIFS